MAKKDFRRLLFDRGLTILRLARESDVSRETIWRWCRGLTKPSTEAVHRVARVLELQPGAVLDAIERCAPATPQPR